MIRTITEAEALTLTIPATDDLLSGFLGPVLVLQDDTPWVYTGRRFDAHYIVPTTWSKHDILTELLYTYSVRLPLSRPEVQAHLVGWLRRGEKCADCGGSGVCPSLHDEPHACHECDGTLWFRKPADLYHLLKPQALGGLPDWIRMALIWGSVVRVATGMSAIVVAGEPWKVSPFSGEMSRLSLSCDGKPSVVARALDSSRAWVYHLKGGGTTRYNWVAEWLPDAWGLGGSDGADACLLANNAALIDDTPTGRVIRFEVPDATP